MIRKLKRRLALLVTGVLILVSAGIVTAIYEFNNRTIITQAEASLEALAEAPGGVFDRWGAAKGSRPERNGDADATAADRPEPEDRREDGMTDLPHPAEGNMLERGRRLSREEVASLSNFYILTLDGEGKIQSWESGRENAYQETELQEFAALALETGKTEGRIDSQFFRLDTRGENRRLIVLDARLEMMAGQRVLWTAALVAGAACLLLSAGAWILIYRMVRPVEEAFRKQQQFVWDASHELKTPLAVIAANADVLEEEIGGNEYLGYIRSEVRRTDELVKNLLTLARMDRGTGDREMRDTDLTEAVNGVLLPFEATVFEAGKTLETDVAEGVRCMGNEAMLQQLTVILLSNALKYSDEGGTIRVKLEKKGRGAELTVRNTGAGIEKKDLTRIFDRFYRTDASRNSETGGEGLGLAIARSITELHRGKIRAESVPGEETAFIVTLP